jgi:uncharacterized repeat protein (TIGR02543 family)
MEAQAPSVPRAPAVSDRIAAGVDFTAGQVLTSPNGRFTLTWQDDGDMVEKDGSTVLLSLSTKGATRALLQKDGNFVVYEDAAASWSSESPGYSAARLQILDDGEVVAYGDDDQPYWSLGAPSNDATSITETDTSFPPRAGKVILLPRSSGETEDAYCTANITARDRTSGEYYMLTAGHCATDAAGTGAGTGQTIRWAGGSGVVDFNTGEWGVAGVKFPNGQFMPSSIWTDEGVRQVIGVAEPTVGTRVCSRGYTSKYEVCGEITQVDTTEAIFTPDSRAKMWLPGDSGGPLYAINADGSVAIVGVIQSYEGFFSRLDYELDNQNLELVTASNADPLPPELGAVEVVRGGHGAVTVTGWALDPASPAESTSVDICLGPLEVEASTNCRTVPANRPSPAAEAAGAETNRGFVSSFTTDERGAVPVYVYTRTATGTVAYIGGSTAKVADVKTVGGVTLSATPTSFTVPAGGTESPLPVAVSTNYADWSVETSQSWVQVSKSGDTVQISVPANVEPARSAAVTITAGPEKRRVLVNQDAPAFYVDPSLVNIRAGATASRIVVTAPAPWEAVSSAPEWLEIGSYPNGVPGARAGDVAGISLLILQITVNTGQARTATITLTSGGETITVTVVVAGAQTVAPVEYTVTFDPNGGWFPPGTASRRPATEGAPVESLPTPVRDGCVFKGWFTAPSGGSEVSPSTVVTEDVTYYAQWGDADPSAASAAQAAPVPWGCTVSFDGNGGAKVASVGLEPKQHFITLPTPARSGYTFKGWFTAPSGGIQVFSRTPVTGSVTYYAQWTAALR